MAGDGEGNLRLPGPVRDFGPGCGMVDFRAAPQPLLERGAVFANIVQQTGQIGLFLPAKRTGKGLCQGGCAEQMVADALGALAVLGNMRQGLGAWWRMAHSCRSFVGCGGAAGRKNPF